MHPELDNYFVGGALLALLAAAVLGIFGAVVAVGDRQDASTRRVVVGVAVGALAGIALVAAIFVVAYNLAWADYHRGLR